MRIDKLEIKKKIKEWELLNIEYDLKKRNLEEIEKEFNKNLERLFDINQNLKEIFQDKSSYENKPKTDIHTSTIKLTLDSITEEEKIKSLYRIIAKSTHPDKIGENLLNQYYIEATQAYKSGEILTIVSICDRLNLSYELDSDTVKLLDRSIDELNTKINFLEKSYHWRWSKSTDIKQKNNIILDYIENFLKK